MIDITERAFEFGLLAKWTNDIRQQGVQRPSYVVEQDDTSTFEQIAGSIASVVFLGTCAIWAIFAERMVNKRNAFGLRAILEEILTAESFF